ncbi:hypothetical protein, partial [Pseudomonas extremaustralis]|uniref:hypothetical protein n=1 Tax=Pseudomonas extremaustralis TaxID=359110 RepID=UPI003D78D898
MATDPAPRGNSGHSAEFYSRLDAADGFLHFAPFSFDGFAERCSPPLCVGAALIMRGDELW